MTSDELKQLEAELWRSADTLRANSDLKSSEYSIPVLGLIFLKFADNKYRQHEKAILAEYTRLKGTRREKPKVLVQDWYKDSQTRKVVQSAVETVLDKNLPESYDRTLFKQKCDRVFDVMLDYASRGQKWAA